MTTSMQERVLRAIHAARARSTAPLRASHHGDRRGRLGHTLALLLLVSQLLISCAPAPAQGMAGGMDATSAEEPAAQRVDLNQTAKRLVQAQAASSVAASSAEGSNALSEPASELSQEQFAAAQTDLAATDVNAAEAAGDEFPLDHTTNVLIMGSDRREGAPNWLTDVMMIVALDYENGRAGVISIPRDIYIDVIPNHQPNKINVVDYLGERDREGGGGPELLGSIIEEKIGIHIDHWVRFDFRGFIALVDALGGVDVEIDCPYYDYFSIEDVVLNVDPGIERLSGDEALVYVRSRRIGGDLDRARRQQRFIWAVRNQVLNENILPRLPSLYNAVSSSVQTDLGIVGILKMSRFAMELDREDITGFVIGYPEVQQGYVGRMWVFRADWEAISAQAQQVFARDPFINTNTLEKCP